jgi:predicted MPP superfamily phosphohydrolase
MVTVISALLASLVVGGLCYNLSHSFPEWWAHRVLRYSAVLLVCIPLMGVLGYGGGIMLESYGLYQWGKQFAAIGFAINLPLSIAFLPLLVWLKLRHRVKGSPSTESQASSPDRRRFLKRAAILPLTSLGLSGAGLVGAAMVPTVREVEVAIPGLDPRLDGFRLLQITDAHLGPYVGLNSFEAVVEQLADRPPDCIALTGDMADVLRLVGPACGLLSQLKPTAGIVASMGNHEYHFPLKDIRKTFDKAQVQLLRSTGTTIKHRGADLYLAGIDDPAGSPQPPAQLLTQSTSMALNDWPTGAMAVALSHRPRGFDATSSMGVPLTLAGHTHGYQLGMGGRSIVDLVAPERYARGLYQQGKHQLYTSAGLGHWFPFRLGCGAEAPVIVLRVAPTASTAPGTL